MKINEITTAKRKQLGMSQKELALRLGIHRYSLCEFEKDRFGLNSRTLEKMLEILGLKIV